MSEPAPQDCPECGSPMVNVFEKYTRPGGAPVYFGELAFIDAAWLLARAAIACEDTNWLVAAPAGEQASRIVFADLGGQLREAGTDDAEWNPQPSGRHLALPNGTRIWAGTFPAGVRLAGAWLLDLEQWPHPETSLAAIAGALEGILGDDACIVLSSTRNPAWNVLDRAQWRPAGLSGLTPGR